MQETIENIVEKVSFDKKEKFATFLNRCIMASTDTAKSTYAIHENVLFKTDVFFEGLAKFLNEVTKDKKLPLGVETLAIVFDELGFDLDKEDAFLLYHLRDLGKFKIKDTKLKQELKGLWGQYKEYALDDQDFSHALKALMRIGIIEYRRGNLSLKQQIIISYKAR
jgi:hypothetical protein